MVDAPSLERFRKFAAVAILRMVTVHAKHLEAGRIVVIAKPLIKSVAADSPDFLSMLVAIVVDVIKRENKRFINSAPPTTIAAVLHNRLVLETIIIIESGLSSAIRIGFNPIFAALIELLFVCSIIAPIVFSNSLSRNVGIALMARANAVFTFPSIPTLCGIDAIELLQRQFPAAHAALHDNPRWYL